MHAAALSVQSVSQQGCSWTHLNDHVTLVGGCPCNCHSFLGVASCQILDNLRALRVILSMRE
jgi:hypothetical protein